MQIRQAIIEDYAALCAIDAVAATSPERRDRIRDWLASSRCYVAAGKDGVPVAYGAFGAEMRVSLINDGPVTLLLDSRAQRRKDEG